MGYPRPLVISRFRELYDTIFAGQPWYQPYTSDGEVAAELASAEDLLFLAHSSLPVGFAWLRRPRLGVGEIEPFGIAPDYQSQGLGRALMATAMERLRSLGATRAQIGVWENNGSAVRFYRRLGFEEFEGKVNYRVGSGMPEPLG